MAVLWASSGIEVIVIKTSSKKILKSGECEQLFLKKPLFVLEDSGHSVAEKRWAGFGKTDSGRPLVVIFTKRGHLLRVISARDMNSKERKFYEENEEKNSEF